MRSESPSPRAADGYRQWQVSTGPDKLPTQPFGPGLPTNLINDMLVARDGTVYAATTAGLAWSSDKGITWQYVRGWNWADKVRNSYGGPPKRWRQMPGCLAGGGLRGRVWPRVTMGCCGLEYRQSGSQVVDVPNSRVVRDTTPRSYAKPI